MTPRMKKIASTVTIGAALLAGAAGIAAASGDGSSGTSGVPATTADVPEPGDVPDAPGEVEADHDQEAGAESDDESGDHDQLAAASSITVDDSAERSESEEGALLASLATVTAQEAQAAALEVSPGTVNSIELENIDGSVVYTVEIRTASGEVDVSIDAGNADVLARETEDQAD